MFQVDKAVKRLDKSISKFTSYDGYLWIGSYSTPAYSGKVYQILTLQDMSIDVIVVENLSLIHILKHEIYKTYLRFIFKIIFEIKYFHRTY